MDLKQFLANEDLYAKILLVLAGLGVTLAVVGIGSIARATLEVQDAEVSIRLERGGPHAARRWPGGLHAGQASAVFSNNSPCQPTRRTPPSSKN